MPVYLSPQPRSPLARAAAAVVGALVLVGALMVGMVAFVVLLGVGLLGGAWFWFRTRHLRRALAEAAEAQAAAMNTTATRAGGEVIDAEYTVVVHQATSADPEANPDAEAGPGATRPGD